MIDLDDYDCVRCGACCVSDFGAADYAYVSAEEAEVFFEAAKEHLLYEERTYGTPMLSMKTAQDSAGNCRCIALRGTVGEDVSCSVYEIRPSVCRNFKPESSVCDAARQAVFGISRR